MSERTDPTRQAAQRLLADEDYDDAMAFDADVRLVAEAVMERNNQSIIGEAHPAKGAGMCDCGRGGVCPGCSRSAMLEACSAENAETCASDENAALEAARAALRGAIPWIGTSGRGAAQEALAVACNLVGYDPADWTSHPEVLARRRKLLSETLTCCNCGGSISEAESNWGWCPECVAADPRWMTRTVSADDVIRGLARREAALQAEVVRLREALEGLNVGARHEFEWVEDARRPGVVNAVCKPDCAKCHAEASLAHDVVVPPGAALNEDA